MTKQSRGFGKVQDGPDGSKVVVEQGAAPTSTGAPASTAAALEELTKMEQASTQNAAAMAALADSTQAATDAVVTSREQRASQVAAQREQVAKTQAALDALQRETEEVDARLEAAMAEAEARVRRHVQDAAKHKAAAARALSDARSAHQGTAGAVATAQGAIVNRAKALQAHLEKEAQQHERAAVAASAAAAAEVANMRRAAAEQETSLLVQSKAAQDRLTAQAAQHESKMRAALVKAEAARSAAALAMEDSTDKLLQQAKATQSKLLEEAKAHAQAVHAAMQQARDEAESSQKALVATREHLGGRLEAAYAAHTEAVQKLSEMVAAHAAATRRANVAETALESQRQDVAKLHERVAAAESALARALHSQQAAHTQAVQEELSAMVGRVAREAGVVEGLDGGPDALDSQLAIEAEEASLGPAPTRGASARRHAGEAEGGMLPMDDAEIAAARAMASGSGGLGSPTAARGLAKTHAFAVSPVAPDISSSPAEHAPRAQPPAPLSAVQPPAQSSFSSPPVTAQQPRFPLRETDSEIEAKVAEMQHGKFAVPSPAVLSQRRFEAAALDAGISPRELQAALQRSPGSPAASPATTRGGRGRLPTPMASATQRARMELEAMAGDILGFEESTARFLGPSMRQAAGLADGPEASEQHSPLGRRKGTREDAVTGHLPLTRSRPDASSALESLGLSRSLTLRADADTLAAVHHMGRSSRQGIVHRSPGSSSPGSSSAARRLRRVKGAASPHAPSPRRVAQPSSPWGTGAPRHGQVLEGHYLSRTPPARGQPQPRSRGRKRSQAKATQARAGGDEWRIARGGYSDELVPDTADSFNALLLRHGVRGAVAQDERAQLLGSPALWQGGTAGRGTARPLSSHLRGLSEMSATEIKHMREAAQRRADRLEAEQDSDSAVSASHVPTQLPLRGKEVRGDPLAEAVYMQGPQVPEFATTADFSAAQNRRSAPKPRRTSRNSGLLAAIDAELLRRQEDMRRAQAAVEASAAALAQAEMVQQATQAVVAESTPSASMPRSATPPRPRASTQDAAEAAERDQLLAEIEALYTD